MTIEAPQVPCVGTSEVVNAAVSVAGKLDTGETLTPRYVTNTGGKIPQPVLEAMPEVLPGADIVLMYGLTEAFRSTYLPPELFAEKMGAIGKAILESARDALAPGGRFVAYQFRDRVHTLGVEVFGRASRQLELLNVPPMRVWRWDVGASER